MDFIPFDGYQLVFSRFGSHNHLGDFLVLPMLISLYFLFKKGQKKYLLPLVLFSFLYIFILKKCISEFHFYGFCFFDTVVSDRR